MSNGGVVGGGASGAAAAHAHAIARATKASGAIVRLAPEQFQLIVNKCDTPLIVTATGGIFKKHFKYLTSYKGLVFYTQSDKPLQFSHTAEIISAGKIWIPE